MPAAAFLILHWPLLGLAELSGDESLYWLYANHPAAGYLTNPPLIGWLVAAGTSVFGDTPVGVRIFPMLVAALGFAALYDLGRELGGVRAGWRSAGLFALVPLAWLYGLMAAPDVPMVALVACGLASVVRGRRRAAGWWWLAGAALGAAFLAKYTAVLVAVAVVGAFLAWGSRRDRLRCLAVAGGWLIVALPHLVWLAGARFEPLLLRARVHGGEAVPGRFGSSLGHLLVTQPAVWSPVVLGLAGWALWELARRRVWRSDPRLGAVLAAAVVPGAALVVVALRIPIHPYWTALSAPAVCVMTAVWLGRSPVVRRRLAWGLLGAQTVVLIVAGGSVLLSEGAVRTGYLAARAAWRPAENRLLAEKAGVILGRLGDASLIAAPHGYATAAQLAFQRRAPRRVLVLAPTGVAAQLRVWEDASWVGRPAVVVFSSGRDDFPLPVYFDECAPGEVVDAGAGRRYELYGCSGYRGAADHLWAPRSGPETEQLVRRLYRTLLGRNPDPGGRRSAIAAIGRGELVHLVWRMTVSEELEARRARLGTPELVRLAWTELAGRRPTPVELAEAVKAAEWGGVDGLVLRRLADELAPDRRPLARIPHRLARCSRVAVRYSG